MRLPKDVNKELAAERLATRPRQISELNRMELERDDETELPVQQSVFLSASPWTMKRTPRNARTTPRQKQPLLDYIEQMPEG